VKKKLLTALLIFAVAEGAFAQWSWNLRADMNVALASWVLPTGERAEKLINVGGNTFFNNTTNNPAANRANFSYYSGYMDFFNFGNRPARANEIYFNIRYSGELISFANTSTLDNLFNTANSGTGANELTGGHSFTQGSGRTPNWGDILRYSFSSWYIRGNFPFLTVQIGNPEDHGKVSTVNWVSMNLIDGIMWDLGLFTPAANSATYTNDGMDINCLLRIPSATSGSYGRTNIPYLMVAARIERFGFPLTIQIAADPGNNFFTGTPFNYKKFGGVVRVSGERVANRITFDAIYKLAGGDPNTLDDYDSGGSTLQPNGDGIYAHQFGVYANILNVPDFRIALGYSGYLKTFEDTLSRDGNTTTKTGPLFSGIDLRFRYSGAVIPVYSNNNISFAKTGTTTGNAIALGVWGQDLAPDNAQNWFAAYNTLGTSYRLNSQTNLIFEIASRLGVVSTDTVAPSVGGANTGEAYSIIRVNHRISGGVVVSYRLNANFVVEGGLNLRYTYDTYTNTHSAAQGSATTRDASGGTFQISVPLFMRMVIGTM